MDFKQALSEVFQVEGGWSNHADDPGGMTNLGVTHRTLRRAIKAGIVGKHPEETIERRLRRLTKREAGNIYRALYWDAVHASSLQDGVDLLVFDAAVNQGVGRAMKFLQKAAGAKPDGIWGPNTQEAVRRTPADVLIRDVSVYRALHYSSLGKLTVFGKGWFRRLFRVHAAAIRERQRSAS